MADMAGGDVVIAVDIGGTHSRVALVGRDGRILDRARIGTAADQDSGLPAIDALIRRSAGEYAAGQLAGIGVAVPGLVDARLGIAHSPVNLPGWQDVALKDHFERSFAVPVIVGNDANLAALGEQAFGAGHGEPNMIYMTISTGIGGGIIAHGRLLLGADGYAGEIGHQTIDINGPRCTCGNAGCLEALASGPAMARAACAALAAGESSSIPSLAGGDCGAISAETIARAAAGGDELAARIIEQTGRYIGIGIANLVHIFNPRLFVLGGGVSNIGEPLLAAIRNTVAERVLPAMRRDLRIVPARLGDDAGLLGAAAQVFRSNV